MNARKHRTQLLVETLESREMPATLVSPTVVTYQDVDGDKVSIKASKPIFAAGTINTVLTFHTGNVNGSNATKQQLWNVNLSILPAAAGTDLLIVAIRSKTTGGNGFVNVGNINAFMHDIGNVFVDGDLGRIRAGNANLTTNGLKSLTVHSLGRFGTTTQEPPNAGLLSSIDGPIGKLIVRTDMIGATMAALGAGAGHIGSVFVGGSIEGQGNGFANGSIIGTGNIGPVIVRGDVIGADGTGSGAISSQGRIASVTIGGSLVGGAGTSSGSVISDGDLGQINIGGGIIGGTGDNSGFVQTDAKLAGINVKGSILGGYALKSGYVESQGDMGTVRVGGSIMGEFAANTPDWSGAILSFGKIRNFRINGSLIGGEGNNSGRIGATQGIDAGFIGGDILGGFSTGTSGAVGTAGVLKSLFVGGSVIAGYGTNTGFIRGAVGIGTLNILGDLRSSGIGTNSGAIESSGNVGTVNIGGSILSNGNDQGGKIEVHGTIGKLNIRGDIVGSETAPVRITMGAAPSTGSNVVLGSLRVGGRVEWANVLAGHDDILKVNADAQIGTVTVGGDWIASNLIAGVDDGGNGFGNSLDKKIAGAGAIDNPAVKSKIASVTIIGQALGTAMIGDHFGIVAEEIGTLKVGGITLPINSGAGNDNMQLSVFIDLKLMEI